MFLRLKMMLTCVVEIDLIKSEPDYVKFLF